MHMHVTEPYESHPAQTEVHTAVAGTESCTEQIQSNAYVTKSRPAKIEDCLAKIFSRPRMSSGCENILLMSQKYISCVHVLSIHSGFFY